MNDNFIIPLNGLAAGETRFSWHAGKEFFDSFENTEILDADVDIEVRVEKSGRYLGVDCEEIRSMGGGANSDVWLQIKSDMCNKRLVTLKNKETACLGSAILAGVGVGVFSDVKSVCQKLVKTKKIYTPSNTDYSECYKNFCNMEDKIV